MRDRKVFVQSNGVTEYFKPVVKPTLKHEGLTEVVLRRGLIGLELERFVIMASCPFQLR